MCRLSLFRRVLEIFAQNIEIDVQPGLVDTVKIASVLELSIWETKQILTTMNEMGVIKSNIDTDYSLVTSEGLNSLNCS